MIDDRSATSGNIVRQVGVKFVAIDAENRASFLDLLYDILGQIRTGMAA